MVMPDKLDGRIRLVEEHVQAENAHDLDRIMTTFGSRRVMRINPGMNNIKVLAEYERTTCGCSRHYRICISPSSADT